MKKSLPAGRQGFTLIEVLVSMFLLVLVMTSFISVTVISMRSFRASRAQYLGSKIAEDGIELVVNKRDNNILCIKPGNCSQLCDWKQGLLDTPGGSCNLRDYDWDVDATKPDQLLAGNFFDNYNASSRICVKPASQNKFGICTTETPITGDYNRKVTVTDVQGLEAVNVKSTVTWTVNGAPASITLEEMLFGIDGDNGGGGGSDMVGWWKLDEDPAIEASIIADSSGSGNNGTLFTGEGATNKSASGVIDRAITFDGVNDYVSVPSINPTSAITVSAWVKSANTTGYSGVWQLVSKYSAYILGTDSGGSKNVCFIINNSSGWQYGSCYAPTDPQNWHYFTGTYDSATGEKKLYMDGVLRSTTNISGNISADTGPINFARRECCTDSFAGQMDDVRVYNRALSGGEILNLYNAGVPDTTPPSAPTGLTATPVSHSRINLSWNDSTDNVGVTGYKVERCQGSGCTVFTEIATPFSTSYSDTGLASNTLYKYKVRAVDAVPNQSGFSSIVSATTQTLSCSTTGSNAFYGCYFNSDSPGAFSTLAATRADAAINFNWSAGSPDPSVTPDLFSARWTGDFNFNAGNYIFTATANDGVRFYIDGAPQTFDQGNGWIDQSTATTYTATYTMTAGTHQIKVEYYENNGDASAQFSWAQPTAGLVGWWRLDDGTGSLTAADSSGNGNTGVLANGPAWTIAGQIGGALSFDGTNDRINLGSPATLDNLSQKTISLWVKYPGTGNIDIPDLVDKQDGGSSGWQLRLDSIINGSDLRLRFIQNFSGTSGDWRTNASTVPYDSWVHVAVAYNKASAGNSPLFYVNGLPVSFSAISNPAGTSADDSAVNAYIGDRFASDSSFKGSIDDVRIYNGILSAAEIRNLYDAGGIPSDPSGLVVTPVSTSQLNLSWNASTDNLGVAGYKVERCQGSGCSSFVQIATPAGNSYSDTGLTAGTSYRYRVRAYDAAGNNSNYSPTASGMTILPSGIIAWWEFDEGSGTIAGDSSGNRHAGTLNLPTWAAGKVGPGALDFNGGWVYTPSVVTTATDNITMSVWAYWQGTSASSYFISNGIGGTDGYGLWISDGACGDGNKVTMILGGITCDALNSNYVMPTNQWTLLTVVREAGTWKLYANGVLRVTGGSSGPLVPTARTSIGGFNGLMDDVRIYNRALSQPEIQQLCDDGGCPTPPPPLSCATIGTNNFYGCYYNDSSPGAFSNLALTRTDNTINFDWGVGSPDPTIGADLFSAKWQGNFTFSAGNYNFTATADDGIRFYVDDILVPFNEGNGWIDQGATTYTATKNMTAGTHKVTVEYYENGGDASAQFSWAASASAASATFITQDNSTKGSWKSVYGQDGYSIIGDVETLPSYISSLAPANHSFYSWADPTTDIRGLEKAFSSARLADTWYSDSAFTVSVNQSNSETHKVAVYMVDWDGGGSRAQTIEVLDASNSNVLDSRSVSGFNGGIYLVWNIQGNVIFRFVNNGSPNAVIGGFFFGSPPPTGLVGWWEFNGNASDSSGLGNNGTFSGGTPSYLTGQLGQALNFDGADDQVNLAGITTGTTFSLSFWIKPNTQGDIYGVILTDTNGDNGVYYHGACTACGLSEKITFYYGGNHVNNTSLPDLQWSHVAISVSAGSVTFYLNGVANGTSASAPSYVATRIGNDSISERLNGILDDVRIYNRALSQPEIQALCDMGTGGCPP